MDRSVLKLLVDVLTFKHVARLMSRVLGRYGSATVDESREGARERWLGLPKLTRHIVVNLAVGLGLALILHAAHPLHLSALVAMEDAAMDWVMRHYVNLPRRHERRAFVLLDIDQASYQAWGEPFYVPRWAVRDLLEFARRGDPALIFVDLDLSKPGADGAELACYLAHYGGGADQAEAVRLGDCGGQPVFEPDSPKPPLVLARTVRPRIDALAEILPPPQRDAFLDDIVAASDNIFWAAPHFQRDDDHVVRRWRLWLRTCTAGDPDVLISVQLLTEALLNPSSTGAKPAAIYSDLSRELSSLRPDCDPNTVEGNRSTHHSAAARFIEIGGKRLSLEPSLNAQRLVYSIPYRLGTGRQRPIVELDGRQIPLFVDRPAYRIVDGPRESVTNGPVAPDPSFIKDRVVVIGGSFQEGRDWHRTPIGDMPGAMVVVNAIHSLANNGQINPPPLWAKLSIEAVLILLMSLIFAHLDSLLAAVVSSALVLILLVPVSFFAFRSGVWVDFAIPLMAVQLHELAADFEEYGAKAFARVRRRRDAAERHRR